MHFDLDAGVPSPFETTEPPRPEPRLDGLSTSPTRSSMLTDLAERGFAMFIHLD